MLVNAKPGFKLSSSSLQSVHSFYYSSPSLKPWLKSKPHLLALRPWTSDWTLLRTSFLICKLKDGTYLTNVLWWLTEMTLQVLSAEQVISTCSFSLPFHWGVNQWPGCMRIFLPADYTCSNFSGTWLTRGRKLQMVLNKNKTATGKKHHTTALFNGCRKWQTLQRADILSHKCTFIRPLDQTDLNQENTGFIAREEFHLEIMKLIMF